MQAKDLTRQKFGKLKVIGKSKHRNKHGDILWICNCDCGGSKLVTSGNLQHGGIKSCGCIWGNPTHGDSGKRIRQIWVGMMTRCYKKIAINWDKYGGAGIKVCKKWHNYNKFKEWAFNTGYSETLSLDRFPNKKGNYSPSNCRWATQKQQQNNKSNNRVIEFKGNKKTLAEWAELYNINQVRLRKRILSGWDIKQALTKPIDKNKISKCYRK